MPELIRVFTPARKLQFVIGKFPDGKPIPMGPFTIPQAVAGVVVLLLSLLLATKISLWLLPIGLVAAVLFVIGLGMIRTQSASLTGRFVSEARLQLNRGPVSASGMPVATTARDAALIAETQVEIVADTDALSPQQRPVAHGASPIHTNAQGRNE